MGTAKSLGGMVLNLTGRMRRTHSLSVPLKKVLRSAVTIHMLPDGKCDFARLDSQFQLTNVIAGFFPMLLFLMVSAGS